MHVFLKAVGIFVILQKCDFLAAEDRISHQMVIIVAVFPEIPLHSKQKLYSFQSSELFCGFSLDRVVGLLTEACRSQVSGYFSSTCQA